MVLSALSLWACQGASDAETPVMPEGKGQLKTSFGGEAAADDEITVTVTQGEKVIEQWNGIGEIPQVISLEAGDYTITARTEGDMPLVSDVPYYNASTDFTVKAGEIAYASLECGMLNMKVSVELSEALQAEYPEWQADLFYLENMDTVFTTLSFENNKPIYITPAAFGITLKNADNTVNRTVIFEEYGAAMYHNVKFE